MLSNSREICRKMGIRFNARRYPPDNQPFSMANPVALSNTKCPSILFSFGFIINDEDANTFSKSTTLESLAKRIIETLEEIIKEGILQVR